MLAIEYHDYGAPDVLSLVKKDIPAPGPGEVLIELRAAGVAPIDWKLRAGLLQAYFQTSFPKIPGRDGAGVVVGIGQGVTDYAIGDRVCVMTGHDVAGCYAQFTTAPVEKTIKMPAELRFEDAASLINAGLSGWIAGIEIAKISTGMKLLIHGGSGAVGGVLVQLARHLGAVVTATCRAANRDYVLSLGADRVIAYDTEDFGSVRDMDVVIDLIGGAVHDRSYPVLRKGGHLIYLVAAPVRERGDEFGVQVTRAMISDRREPVEQIMALYQRGVIQPQVAMCLPLHQAADAHRMMEAGTVTRGRLILQIP